MKKILLLVVLVIYSNSVFSQYKRGITILSDNFNKISLVGIKNLTNTLKFNSSFEILWENALKLSTDFLNAVDKYVFYDDESIFRK